MASLGADQFNLGTTEPPSSIIVDFILWWMSCQSKKVSASSKSESVSEEASDIPLSSSRSVLAEEGEGEEGGRTMPSAPR